MILSRTLLESLRHLLDGEMVAASSLRKDIAGTLLSEGLLTVRTKGSRRTYSAIDRDTVREFLSSHYEQFRDMEVAEAICKGLEPTRSAQAFCSGNSKLVAVRACPGFPVNSYEPILCRLGGKEFVVYPQEGSFLFVTDWQNFEIPGDIVVVGIENMENFRLVRRQSTLFSSLIVDRRLLFVSRYPQSADLRVWLQSIPNEYVHFGDFDLAGINIFLTEFHKYLGDRASFLIPSDIEKRLKNGSIERFNSQYNKFKNLSTDNPSLQHLIDLINLFHRCYDQEGYMG